MFAIVITKLKAVTESVERLFNTKVIDLNQIPVQVRATKCHM
jgi:hypothetical protein